MLQDKGVGTIVSYLPQWVVEKFSGLLGWDEYCANVQIPKTFFMDLVQERMERYEQGSTKDFIDTYITTINATDDPNSSFHKEAGSKF